jgi:hypothetical protein
VREGAKEPEPLPTAMPKNRDTRRPANFPTVPVLIGAGVVAAGAAAAITAVSGKKKKSRKQTQ